MRSRRQRRSQGPDSAHVSRQKSLAPATGTRPGAALHTFVPRAKVWGNGVATKLCMYHPQPHKTEENEDREILLNSNKYLLCHPIECLDGKLKRFFYDWNLTMYGNHWKTPEFVLFFFKRCRTTSLVLGLIKLTTSASTRLPCCKFQYILCMYNTGEYARFHWKQGVDLIRYILWRWLTLLVYII